MIEGQEEAYWTWSGGLSCVVSIWCGVCRPRSWCGGRGWRGTLGGEIFGDDMAAVAMVGRLILHAEPISLKGDSYRLKNRDLGPDSGRPEIG